jgi:Ca-activated chloride channel family protein
MQSKPVHRTILAVDIQGFGRHERDDDLRARLREAVHRILDEALSELGITPGQRAGSDTGDGVLVLIDAPHKGEVLDAVGGPLERGLRRHNELASEKAQLRLRVVVHAGEVVLDEHGATGDDVIHAFRLLNSGVLRDRLARIQTPMALIVSESVYHLVRQRHSRFEAADFQRVLVVSKETRAWAWCYPAPPAAAGRRRAISSLVTRRRGRKGGRRGRRRLGRRAPGGRPRPWVAALLLALLLAGWAVPALLRERRQAERPCPLPVELIVQTTPAMEATLHDLAQGFTEPDEEHPCRTARFTVFSVPSASRSAAAVAGWTADDLVLGPKPAVWIPDDSVELDRVKLLPGGDTLESLGSVTSSPVVLAVPEAAAGRLGQPRRSAPWRTMLGWGRAGAGGQQLRLVRADPTSSTVGLLATGALYAAAGGATTLRPGLLAGGQAPRRLHDVEQVVETSGDELAGLCALAVAAGGRRAPDGLLIAEQTMVAHNREALDLPCGPGPAGAQDRLVGFYPADGTPVLDHPYVLLPAAAAFPARERLAREFFAYLRSAGQAALLAAGFRTDRGRTEASERTDGVLRSEPRATLERPAGTTFAALTTAWERARKPVRALLAVDVSRSMGTPYPGEGGRRITAARAAAEEAVDLTGGKDQIGLWRFSRDLVGRRDHQELVRLGPAPERRPRIQDRLRGLEPTSMGSALSTTLDAGVTFLRAAGPHHEAVNALVILTGGEGGAGPGGMRPDALRDRLDRGEPVLVFMVTFGSVHCDTGALADLVAQAGPSLHCLDAGRLGARQAFERIAAELWGTRADGGSEP